MSAIQQLITEHMDIWTAADTEKRSGRGRASSNAGSVYGVKKLRELILELAVRGKLVAQDANDEPASELLKRIQAEKAKLVAEGKIKKEKPLAPITDDEKIFELPHGWVLVRNCELFQLRKGRIPKSLNEDELGLPYLDIDALDRNIIRRYSEELTCPQSTDKDILVVCDGSRSGLVLDGKNGIIGSTLSIIDTPVFIQNYIKLIFKQGFEIFNTSMKGAAIPHLDTQKLLQNPTALPPLAEQHRIVAKVDELMTLCDQLEQQHSSAQEAHETLVSQLLATLTQSQNAAEFNDNWQRIAAHFDTLFTTEASIDALKQTLLQLAVMGKLVPQDQNDEPASELLKRIQDEKAKQLRNKKIRDAKVVIASDMPSVNLKVPNGWALVRIADLLVNPSDDIVDGPFGSKLKASEYTTDGTPIIRIQNIDRGLFKENGIQFISEDKAKELKRHSFISGDVVLNKLGEPAGKTCIVPESLKNGVIVADIIRIRLDETLHLKSYFVNCMNSPFVAEQFSELAKGVTRQRVNLSEVRSLSLPLAPLAEQHRIVAKVDVLMELCDELKTCIQQANQQQQAIADALVGQAVA